MTQKPPAQRIDERLTTLLEIEQQLEARFREAEAVGRAKIEAARAALAKARHEGLAAVDEISSEEERADAAAHEAALRAIEEERNAALTKLTSVTGAELDRLARAALARVIAPAPPRKGGAA